LRLADLGFHFRGRWKLFKRPGFQAHAAAQVHNRAFVAEANGAQKPKFLAGRGPETG
jgi:hypothetical protein